LQVFLHSIRGFCNAPITSIASPSQRESSMEHPILMKAERGMPGGKK
jgi:hypothetical protein